MLLGLFRRLTKHGSKWAELVQLVQKIVPRSRVGIFQKERTRSTPLEPKLMFWSVFYYLGAFGTVWLPYKTRYKTGQSWCKSSCHEVLSEFFEMNAPDPPHWTLNLCVWVRFYNLGAFRTVWLPNENWSKMGRTSAKVCATKSCRNFSQWTHPIHPIGPKSDILERFVLFGCIWDCWVVLQNSGPNGPN